MAIVYLVGAGPGDYKLISLKAIECLKKAQVVVYDRLADDRILKWAKDDAEFIYVGKASSQHTMRQEDISQLLVDKAKEGKCVVRLKGGDPFVFGRGGEEALLLEENNIPFEIVPGITSAISVPAYAGIPVTHRAVATSFAVITGHEDPTKGGSNMRWDKLSTGTDTLVFLMGVANLPNITQKLITGGRAADTPAAVIRWGTKAEQKVLVTTVGNAAADVAKNNIKPPAIFIVGEVVKLRDKLQWFDNPNTHPLFGKTVLVTRARSQASKLTARLEALGAKVIEAPAIELTAPTDNYAAIDAAIENIHSYHWLIFTSANGVDAFFKRLNKAGKDTRALGYSKIAAIGSATAEKLAGFGIIADALPREFIAEGIAEELKNKLPPHAKILVPRAEVARNTLIDTLTEMGANVTVAPVYKTVDGEFDTTNIKNELEQGKIDLVTFTSSSTVKNLVKLIGGSDLLAQAKTAVIGPITEKTLNEYNIKADISADSYTIDGLVEAIKAYFIK